MTNYFPFYFSGELFIVFILRQIILHFCGKSSLHFAAK